MTTSTIKMAISLSALSMLISANIQASPYGLQDQHSFDSDAKSHSPLPKRYIVKFKNAGSSTETRSTANILAYKPRINEVFSQHRALNSVSANEIIRIGRSNGYTAKLNEESVQALSLRADVDYVEEDVSRHLLNDTLPWGQKVVGATLLSDTQTGNRTICIIDSGYDASHNDLSGNNVSGTNDSGTDDWFDPGHNNAHGTHVAGTIAAIANDQGVVGIMPNQNVNIHIIKVFNEAGWGYSSSLIKAIDTCVNNDANVISMSLGGDEPSITERKAITAQYKRGVLLIAAAGNDGDNSYSYPASYDAVMSVGAVDSNKDHASFVTDQYRTVLQEIKKSASNLM
ncbi:subtilase family protease/peptidase inhibitor I9 [Shewanella psychrophila]|uniref:Subtilase family protease/peptidase inhibitor I9 n=1 Tax=Shewanella psychrophila TaxID=225848 RepID=A0A1S6HL22_9GAMM|nr:subtilase family protease/peptidase inhibitor I9 [Shewanella psychrophila]